MANKGTDNTIIKVGIVDDHVFVTSAFVMFLNAMPGIKAVLEAYSGEQLINILKTTHGPLEELPDILLMDVELDGINRINGMTGIETTKAVTDLYPTIKIIAFTGKKDEWTILQMIGAGACAYLSKQVLPHQLEQALHEVYQKGKYMADLYHLYSAELRAYSKSIKDLSFTENEKRYLKLLSKGFNYGQMAAEIEITVKGIDYIHRRLSEKLNTKSHVTMALDALRMGIITLYD